MLWLFAGSIGLLMGAGAYLALRAQGFPIVLGLMLLTYGTNLFVFAAGGLQLDQAPVMAVTTQSPHNATSQTADPLPQALVLTAIVIGFAMTALVLTLVLRALVDLGSEDVDTRAENSPAKGSARSRVGATDPAPDDERNEEVASRNESSTERV